MGNKFSLDFFNLSGKVAIVTGGNTGLGMAYAEALASCGADLLVTTFDDNISEVKEIVEGLGRKIVFVKGDLTKKECREEVISTCLKEYSRIDILVNNAGISRFNLFTDISYDEWHEVMNVNLNSVFYVTKKALQYMIPEHEGKIINISSMWGLVGSANEVHYSTSKAALIGMTKALAKELGPSNIQVNCIAPGVIETDMLNDVDEDTIEMLKYDTPLMRIGKPMDIARCALFLASEGGDFITGQVISSNGGFVIN